MVSKPTSRAEMKDWVNETWKKCLDEGEIMTDFERGYEQGKADAIKKMYLESLLAHVRTSAENLARIREILKPTITELANLFGVSRQAVYDWQAGKPLAQENAAKLDDLAKAADALAATGIDGSSQLLRRKIAGSKSLLDVVREGGSATSAAQVLAQTLVREAKQRERLALRLAGRAKPNVPHDDKERPWVGLTKEEAKEISLANRPYVIDMIAALEARLKEKNT